MNPESFRTLAELSTDWFWEQDAEHRFTDVTGGPRGRMPLAVDRVRGRTRWELAPDALTPEQWTAHRRALAAREPFELEYRIPDANGASRWLLVRGVPRYGADGTFLGYHGTSLDIHERKLAEAALDGRTAVLKATLENMAQGISVVDGELRLIGWNQRFLELLDFPASLAREGAAFEDFIRYNAERGEYGAGDVDELVRSRVELARRFLPHRLKRTRPDGTVLEIVGTPMPGGGLVTTYTDITEQERTEDRLRRERDFRQKMIESLPGVFYLFDESGRFMLWNRNLEAVTGFSAEEVAGAHPLDFFEGEDRRLIMERIGQALHTGRASAEAMFAARNGTKTPYYFTGQRIDVDGTPALLGLGIDITERRQAEQLIRTLNETLEQRVRERTAELEASNQELESFSYSVSHDLRAPLRALDGFGHLLEDEFADTLNETGRSYLKRIRAASQRMGTLIDDLLDLARVSRQELHRVPVDLSALAAEICETLREQAPGRKVTVRIAPGLQARADPVLAKLALENLLHNAWKFTGERSDALIEFGRCAAPEGEAFCVRDNGAGFEMVYADKLFKPFQRLHDFKRFEGTGIGLAIVQRILQRHGGRAWAQSTPDRGAAFHFTLPS